MSRSDTESRTRLFEVTPPQGSGEMARRMAEVDWRRTPLGPPASWPRSLRGAVRMVLAAQYPMLICWGPEYVQIYNDAYRPVLGEAKHPEALGQSSRDCWPEIWHVIGPMFDRVMDGGPATGSEDTLFVLERNRYVEETYFTFSYSALYDDDGIGGVLVTCVETTERVLGERRLKTLRRLAERGVAAQSAERVCSAAGRALEHNAHDVPFALFYLLEADDRARLVAATGVRSGSEGAPLEIALDEVDAARGFPWPVAEVFRSGEAVSVPGLAERAPDLDGGPWPEPTDVARIVPVSPPHERRPRAVLVAGISPRRVFDDDYDGFLHLVGREVGSAIAGAEALQEERRRAEALAELDRLKTDFFSNVSHEFRTPITLMLSPLDEILESGAELDPGVRDSLVVARRSCVRLLKLVDALLDFSRIEGGRVVASTRTTDLAALTADIAGMFRSAMERGGLDLVVECPSEPVVASVDTDMWEKIVLNLLSNALKYTLEGEVTVELLGEGDEVRLRVTDTGVGIPPHELPYLFDRFHRVPTGRARTHEGAGIGLAMVKELTELHGGRVSADSTQGEGSVFTVRIPTGAANGAPDRPEAHSTTSRRVGSFVDEALGWLPGEELAPFQADPAALTWPSASREVLGETPGAPGVEEATVLVVDDNQDVRSYLSRLLGRHWPVETARDGTEGIALARERKPDLVLCDVMMPVVDGFEVVRTLRGDPRTRDARIILVSALADEESRLEALQAGADDYLVKPFRADELVGRVGAHLELARLERASEKRVLDLVARITDGFWTLDPDWNVTFVNARGAELLGVEPEELLGRNLWELFPEAVGNQFHRALHRALRDQVPVRVEDYYEPFERWYEARAYPSPSGLTVFHTEVTDRRLATEALEAAKDELEREVSRRTAQLRSLSRRLLNAREDERRRLAHALHDDIGQVLTAVSLGLGRAMAAEATDREEVRELLTLVHRAADQVREASFTLRPLVLDDMGIAAALEWYIDRHSERVDYPVRFESDIGSRVPRAVETACYRVTQEALTNIARHAHASEASIELRIWDEALRLTIRDDGVGFDLEERDSRPGMERLGLLGMKEMASLVDGTVAIESAPGHGTTVRATFPVDKPRESEDDEGPGRAADGEADDGP